MVWSDPTRLRGSTGTGLAVSGDTGQSRRGSSSHPDLVWAQRGPDPARWGMSGQPRWASQGFGQTRGMAHAPAPSAARFGHRDSLITGFAAGVAWQGAGCGVPALSMSAAGLLVLHAIPRSILGAETEATVCVIKAIGPKVCRRLRWACHGESRTLT